MIREKAAETGIDYDYYYQFTIDIQKQIKRAYDADSQELIADGISDLKQEMNELECNYKDAEKQEGGK